MQFSQQPCWHDVLQRSRYAPGLAVQPRLRLSYIQMVRLKPQLRGRKDEDEVEEQEQERMLTIGHV
jgi:hypothetical protein